MKSGAAYLSGAVLLLGALTEPAYAQIPDVRFQLNAIGSFAATDPGSSNFRFYSVFGRPSVASLRFTLETGFTGFISQKLERIPRDGDPDQLDQAYLEDAGIWRVGKQVLPFGTTEILRETAIGARADTSLIFEGLPVAAVICDAGPGRQRGFVGRIGTRSYGFSLAVGHHFGIDGTSLSEDPASGRNSWGRFWLVRCLWRGRFAPYRQLHLEVGGRAAPRR